MVRRARPATAPAGGQAEHVFPDQFPPDQPVRTCIGCRKRAPASELLRIVAIELSPGQFSALPDPARRRPGRGAHLHPDQACLALAQRRRVFGRSLRVTGVVDTGELVEAVTVRDLATARPAPPAVGAASPTRTSKVGRPT